MAAEGDVVVIVRTSKVWWMLLLAAVGLLIFAMAAPIDAADRIFVSAGVAAFVGFCWAGLTARIEGRGNTLAVVGVVRVVLLSADGIERIDEEDGPVLITRDGRRWDSAVFHMYAEHPWAAATTRRRAEAIRSWLTTRGPKQPASAVVVHKHARTSVIRWTMWGVCLAVVAAWGITAI